MTSDRKKLFAVVLAAAGLFGVHVATGFQGPAAHAWHVFFGKLYFIPIVAAAIWFGIPGALAASLSCIGLYAVHLRFRVPADPMEAVDHWGEMVSYLVLAVVSGTLVTLERRARDRALRSERRAEREKIGTAVETLTETLAARDPETKEHSRRVAELAEGFASFLGLPGNEVRSLRLAGLLHDIGKIGIRDDVLLKPDALTPEEREEIMQHPRIGEKILAPIGFESVIKYIAVHHENIDGSGYPDGLRGEEIPLPGRVLAIVDTHDALRSQRFYKEPLSEDQVREVMSRMADTKLDGQLLEKFWEYLRKASGRQEGEERSAPSLTGELARGPKEAVAAMESG